MIKRIILILLLYPIAGLTYTCGNLQMEFYDLYAVTSNQDDQALSVYAMVRNRDPVNAHTITEVSSPGARKTVIQSFAKNSEDDDSPTATVGEITIPAGGVYLFRPGHTHIVLSGYKNRPGTWDEIDVTFTFADNCSQTITGVPVDSDD